jgi:hypothetical protein
LQASRALGAIFITCQPHAQCVNAAVERYALPTASHPDLIRLQEGVGQLYPIKSTAVRLACRLVNAEWRKLTVWSLWLSASGMLEMMPQPPDGSRQSKKCCAELVITSGTTTAEANPDDHIKRRCGPRHRMSTQLAPSAKMLGDMPEMARLIG